MKKTIFGIGHKGFESEDLYQAIKKQFGFKEQDCIDDYMVLGNFIEGIHLNKSCSNTVEKEEEKQIKKIGDTLFKEITTTTVTSNSHKILQKEKGKN